VEPKIVNLICPKCRLTWMCKNGSDKFYFCYACSFILFDKQVEGGLTNNKGSGIMKCMRTKLYNFFNSPWVAFPLMILLVAALFVVAIKCQSWHFLKLSCLERAL